MNIDNFDSVLENYETFFDDIKSNYFPVWKKGIKEGIKEGVKNGIFENVLSEISILGFLNIKKQEIKTIDKIIEDNARENVERLSQKAVKEQLCPIMKKDLKQICDITVDLIKKQDFTVNKNLMEAAKNIEFSKIFDPKIQELEDIIEKSLPQNFIIQAIFKGVQKASCECINEGIEICNKKIHVLIISKTSG